MVVMKLDTKPASDYPTTDLLQFLNLGFESYLVPIHFELPQFLTMLRKDNIDLNSSRVLLAEDKPAGIALIARRGTLRASRLAAMGIEKGLRGKKAGSWFMERLVQESRERSDREMVLEVIEQNEAAVRLYHRRGFQTVRRLIGFVNDAKPGDFALRATDLHELDLREVGRLVLQHGLPDLPWQLSGETIALLNPPARAYKDGKAWIALSNPDAEHVVIWSLLVEPQARGRGLAVQLLENVMAKHMGKTWHVPALLPEEFGNVFERAGFQREELWQWQMRLAL